MSRHKLRSALNHMMFKNVGGVPATVVITSSESSPTAASPIPVTITFSEEVSGFVIGDITVGNSTIGNFATFDNIVFTADVTPDGAGIVTVDIAANVVAGNGNQAAEQFEIGIIFTVTLSPTDDITLFKSAPTLNYGVYNLLRSRLDTAPSGKTSLVKYDLSSLPAAAIISSATAKITNTTQVFTATTFTWSRILDANSDWIEGTQTGVQAPSGEPCWDAKKADGAGGITTKWVGDGSGDGGADAGCSQSGTDYSATPFGTFASNNEIVGTEYGTVLDLTEFALMRASNNGMILTVPTNTDYYFASRQHATEAYRPELTIVYQLLPFDLAAVRAAFSSTGSDIGIGREGDVYTLYSAINDTGYYAAFPLRRSTGDRMDNHNLYPIEIVEIVDGENIGVEGVSFSSIFVIQPSSAVEYAFNVRLTDGNPAEWVGNYHGNELSEIIVVLIDDIETTINDGDLIQANVSVVLTKSASLTHSDVSPATIGTSNAVYTLELGSPLNIVVTIDWTTDAFAQSGYMSMLPVVDGLDKASFIGALVDYDVAGDPGETTDLGNLMSLTGYIWDADGNAAAMCDVISAPPVTENVWANSAPNYAFLQDRSGTVINKFYWYTAKEVENGTQWTSEYNLYVQWFPDGANASLGR